MRVLILGGNGFVGSYLKDYFLIQADDVRTSSRTSGDFGIDFTQKQDYFKIFGNKSFDLVISCITSYSDDIDVALRGNVISNANIIDCFSENCGMLIFISSVSALPQNSLTNAYAITKHMEDSMIAYLSRRTSQKICVLRFCQIFDKARKAANSQKGLYFFVDSIKNNKSIIIFDKNSTPRSFIPVEVLCEIVGYAAQKEITGFHNIVLNPHLSFIDLFKVLSSNAGYDDNLLIIDKEKEAQGYYIPPSSEVFKEKTQDVDVTTYLINLIK
jgi:nucleoside-diphosphate-sugar epimerase